MLSGVEALSNYFVYSIFRLRSRWQFQTWNYFYETVIINYIRDSEKIFLWM